MYVKNCSLFCNPKPNNRYSNPQTEKLCIICFVSSNSNCLSAIDGYSALFDKNRFYKYETQTYSTTTKTINKIHFNWNDILIQNIPNWTTATSIGMQLKLNNFLWMWSFKVESKRSHKSLLSHRFNWLLHGYSLRGNKINIFFSKN